MLESPQEGLDRVLESTEEGLDRVLESTEECLDRVLESTEEGLARMLEAQKKGSARVIGSTARYKDNISERECMLIGITDRTDSHSTREHRRGEYYSRVSGSTGKEAGQNVPGTWTRYGAGR